MWKKTLSHSVLLLISISCIRSEDHDKECVETEKSLTLLDLAMHSVSQLKDLVTQCKEAERTAQNELFPNITFFGVKEKSLAHIEISLRLIEEAKKRIPACKDVTRREDKTTGSDVRELTTLSLNPGGEFENTLTENPDYETEVTPVTKENSTKELDTTINELDATTNKLDVTMNELVTKTNELDVTILETLDTVTEDRINRVSSTKATEMTEKPDEKPLPRDCFEAQDNGAKEDGIYRIRPTVFSQPLEVYCDMRTNGGGWTVIQRRGNPGHQREDFFRDWDSYKRGFGNVTKDFWLGNDNIYLLTSNAETSVRFEMEDIYGYRRFAAYNTFRLESENNMYKLHIMGYSGDAGDSMSESNGLKFSTRDKRNDQLAENESCALKRSSGWWFGACSDCNLNGIYQPGRSFYAGISWQKWKRYECMNFVEIKIRRRRMFTEPKTKN